MRRRIGIASAIWTASILLSRVVGLVRDRVLGSTLGVDGTADVYAAAFRIPDFFNYLLAGGALSIVFIPLFTAHLERGDEAEGWRSFSTIANFLLLLMAILTPPFLYGMPVLTAWIAPGFSPEQQALLVHLSRIVFPAQIFHLVGGLLSAALLSRDRHALPALTPLVYNGCIIAGGLIGRSAEGFAWGVLVGAIVGPFGLPLVGNLRAGLRWGRALDWHHPDFPVFLRRFVPIMVGQSVIVLDDMVLTWFGSALPAGHVATLNYGKTLMRVPMGVFGAAMGYASYPTLTRLCQEGRLGEAWRTIVEGTRRVLFYALGSQVVLTVAGAELATAIYTTRRIPPERLVELGVCAGLFSLALGAWSAQAVLARGFYARGVTWLPTWLGTGVLVVSLPIYAGLARVGGLYGLATASSVVVVAYTVLLERILRRQMGEGEGVGSHLGRAGLATLVGIGAGLAVRSLLWAPRWTTLDALVRALVLGGVGGGVYLGVCAALGVEDVRRVLDGVRRRLRTR